MWQVFIWSPTRGWKLAHSFRSQDKAVRYALEFLPLEVKLSSPYGRSWYSGTMCMPDHSTPSIAQIETLLPTPTTAS